MNGRVLIIECGAAETRAALIDNDRVRRFWFGPARGDEAADGAARAGRRFAGRVTAVDQSLGAAFLDIGDGLDGYLPIKKACREKITEGALIAVFVKSPPRQGKGAALKFLDEDVPNRKPGRIEPIEDAAVEAARAIGAGAQRIIVDDGRARAALSAAELKAEIDHEDHLSSLFEACGADAELESAFAPAVPISGGGNLIIDETQALTAIDVDTAGLAASSPARLREKIAVAAAFEAARQIGLRNIGGHVAIDFPSLDTKASRDRFREKLRAALSQIDGAGALSFSKSGLCSFTVPHHAQSLLERFTEPASNDPVPGRRFTLDWRAKSALRRLEERLRAAPRAKLRLVAGVGLSNYLNRHPVWLDRLRDRCGARFEVVTDKQVETRTFDLSEQ